MRFFPYARQGRIKVYFFAQDSTGYNDPVGQYEIIGNYREDTTAMKALKAGTPQHPKGEKCLEGVKARKSANGSNGYDITFTGFRGHTYVVSMYDNKGEMVQQWFHTQFQVEEAELEPAHGRRVKYTWRDLQISRPANWDAATATYKGEKIPMDSSRPSPHGARRRKKHKTLEHRPAWCPQSAKDLKKMKIVVTDVTPPAQRRAAAGGGKLAAAVAWPEERAYEEDQMKKIWSHNRVGGAKFYQLMRSMFIGISRDRVTEWVQAQTAYATTMKGGGGALMGYVTQPIIAAGPRIQQAIDLTFIPKNAKAVGEDYNFAKSSTHYYVAVLIDVFSKFVWIRLINDKRPQTVTKHVLKIWREYGAPQHLQSDQGSEFLAEFERMCTLYQVQRHYCAAYNSPCNGVVERVNRTIKGLRDRGETQAVDQEYLDRLAFSINNTAHEAIGGKTPMECHMQVRMTNANMAALMDPEKYVFRAVQERGYPHHPLFNIKSEFITDLDGTATYYPNPDNKPENENRAFTVTLSLAQNRRSLAREMPTQTYPIALTQSSEDNLAYTASIQTNSKGQIQPQELPVVLLKPQDILKYYGDDPLYDHSRFYHQSLSTGDSNISDQKCVYSGYLPPAGYYLTQQGDTYVAPLLAALHLPSDDAYVWVLRKDYTKWHQKNHKTWASAQFFRSESDPPFHELPTPTSMPTLALQKKATAQEMLEVYQRQRSNTEEKIKRSLLAKMKAQKLYGDVNKNLATFELESLKHRFADALKIMKLQDSTSVEDLHQEVDTWLKNKMVEIAQTSGNHREDHQKTVKSIKNDLLELASPDFITERLEYVEKPFNREKDVWDILQQDRGGKSAFPWGACTHKEWERMGSTDKSQKIRTLKRDLSSDFNGSSFQQVYQLVAKRALSAENGAERYGQPSGKVQAAVTAALHAYLKDDAMKLTVERNQMTAGGKTESDKEDVAEEDVAEWFAYMQKREYLDSVISEYNALNPALQLEVKGSSARLELKDSSQQGALYRWHADRARAWFNGVQMAGAGNLRRLVAEYNEYNEKKNKEDQDRKLDLLSIERDGTAQQTLYSWYQRTKAGAVLSDNTDRAKALQEYNEREHTHTKAVARRGIVKQARAMLGRVARKLAPVEVNAVVRVSLFALKNQEDDDRVKARKKAKSFKACQQYWTPDLFRVVHRRSVVNDLTQNATEYFMIEPFFQGIPPTDAQVERMQPDRNPEHPRAAMVLRKALGGGGGNEYHQHYTDAADAETLKAEKTFSAKGSGTEETHRRDDQLDVHEKAYVSTKLGTCWCSANFDDKDLARQNALGPYRRWYTRNDLLLVAPAVEAGQEHAFPDLDAVQQHYSVILAPETAAPAPAPQDRSPAPAKRKSLQRRVKKKKGGGSVVSVSPSHALTGAPLVGGGLAPSPVASIVSVSSVRSIPVSAPPSSVASAAACYRRITGAPAVPPYAAGACAGAAAPPAARPRAL